MMVAMVRWAGRYLGSVLKSEVMEGGGIVKKLNTDHLCAASVHKRGLFGLFKMPLYGWHVA